MMSNILDISSQHLPVHSEKTIIQKEEDKEMKEWYRQQINQMIMHINDELFLKRIFIIIRNHIKREG